METQTLKYPAIRNYVAGQPIDTPAAALLDVFSPLSGAVISAMPLSSAVDLDAAVKAAKTAFPAWSAMPIKERVQIFYRYKTLLERDMKALADLVREENGKTFDEARAEVEKAVELTEFACSSAAAYPGRISGSEQGRRGPRRAQAAGRGGQHRPLQLSLIWCRTGPSRTRWCWATV